MSEPQFGQSGASSIWTTLAGAVPGSASSVDSERGGSISKRFPDSFSRNRVRSQRNYVLRPIMWCSASSLLPNLRKPGADTT